MVIHPAPGVTLINGESLAVLRKFGEARFDAVVTDPPYELGFMGKAWDGQGIAYSVEFWREVLRVLKPGGHLLAFGATRTYHRMTGAIEDAGFEVRDSLHWMYATGFPKSLNVALTMDKQARGFPQGVSDPEKRGKGKTSERNAFAMGGGSGKAASGLTNIYDKFTPTTDLAKQWEGWGTALKPAHEPIVMARRPLVGTVAENVQAFGTGALNIDACRIGGRWPANVMLDEHAAAELDAQTPDLRVGGTLKGGEGRARAGEWVSYGDAGGASRFFFVAKPSRRERDLGCDSLPARTGGEATDREDESAGVRNPRAGANRGGGARNFHPTVKPIALMRHLVRLVTPPGGCVLDPFLGSGTTGIAARLEGFGFLGIEREAEYMAIAAARVAGGAE